jgi:hypothetical protein
MLKNNFKNIFVVIMMAFVAVVANAQTAQTGEITISEEERALALSVFTNGECFEAFTSDDGVLTWEGHGGAYVGLSGNMTSHHLSNNDGVGGTGTKTTFGGDAILGYRAVRKGWALAIRGEVYGGVNASYNCENRRVGENFHAGARALVENSHGWANFGLGLGYEYEQMVSENANATPWRGHVHKPVVLARITKKIFSIGHVKNARVGNKEIPVRGLREVNFFAQASYSLADIGKYWDDADALQKGFEPELKSKDLKIEIGLTFNLR